MSNWIVIPVKRLSAAKSRLAGILNPAERSRLTASMLDDVLTATARIPEAHHMLVATFDRAVARIAVKLGAEILSEEAEDGLNQAVRRAIEYSTKKKGTRLAIVHADIPLIKPYDLSHFLRVDTPGMMIAPSRDFRGTNILSLSPPDLIIPRYGRRSFDKHHVLAERIGITPIIVENDRLALDIDTPYDLKRLCELSPRGRTGQFLSEHKVSERLRKLPRPRINAQMLHSRRRKQVKTNSIEDQVYRLTVRR